MPDPVPIYMHRNPGDWYYYDQDKTKPSSAWSDGTTPFFYAYPAEKQKKVKQVGNAPDGKNDYDHKSDPGDPEAYYYEDIEGTIAIYRHRPGNADLYTFDSQPDNAGGGSGKKAAFYAYELSTQARGTVPLYEHISPDKKRNYYDTHETAPSQGWSGGTAVAKVFPVGYRVGDSAADISGSDQQNKAVKLSDCYDGKSWVWIDISAAWCPPCQGQASRTKAFLASINGQGLPLKLFSVLTDDRMGQAAGQAAASQWATRYDFDSVVHSGGDPASEVRQLAPRYGLLNGSYPCYPTNVLVDPAHVIRKYEPGFDLDGLKAALASQSRHPLT